ncbi:MAG: DNA topoisomerase VI subunit B [Methanocalculus sp. MSAO_Arc1]|uniref:DNA topoisomerase VI subunit B n=1 Tax=Methanocalculus TaxID=71151 RepID=UPI000FF4FDE0|nr:DNA topoisomerase VI subunit B [Methanocalculus sp. MSAO_Arc1]MCP1663155.1 DNA topoisomerase-6 subunit B [Methanocalculus sp. AMF5]RQD79364.1 MAG: DNA topoisomerase VI subunit B [Methanocalculus sp. MSAO_Arc1]
MVLAEELAKQQKSISVAEFFEKNKHLLGFDSPIRGLITTLKEAIDNALDACEEAAVLPDILVIIRKTESGTFTIAVEDNGPGIVPQQVPFVFGKLLYGSRFHQVRQSRGQQGIGISAAVLYAQLTSGVPATVISRTSAKTKAHKFSLMINTRTNEPDVLSHEEIEWALPHGTRIELEFESSISAKKRLLEYLKYTSIVNPHARFRIEIDSEGTVFERVSGDIPPCPQSIRPHPYGIEFGILKRMAAASDATVETFLQEEFSRVGKKTATEILAHARVPASARAADLDPQNLKKILAAMQEVRIPAPPASTCLSPIGEELILSGLEKEFALDFVKSRSRAPGVFSGHSFVVEAAIGYGGRLEAEGSARIMRFANRVPLLYQQGACAITQSVASVNWKSYGIAQSGLPQGPVLILVHIASTNVPFTSESKDAVASIPEIEKEIVLALQDLGRDLKAFLSRRDRSRIAEDRARAVCAIIPDIADKVAEIVGKPVPETAAIEGRIMRRVVVKRGLLDGRVQIRIDNHTTKTVELTLYDISNDSGEGATVAPDFSTDLDGEVTKCWRVALEPAASWATQYPGAGGGSLTVQGMDESQMVVMDLLE